MNLINILRDLAIDRWYRSELIRALGSGPAAVSLYFSLLIGLLSSFLASLFMREMETASRIIFLLMVILSWGFVMCDLWLYLRNHGLELLRRAGQRCERRMRRLQVESSSISAFLDRLYSDSDLERIFPQRPNESIQSVLKALDRLSGTAIRYGRGGKHVFMQNLKSCLVVDLLFGSGGIELMSEPLAPEINQRLEQVPCYDPEGWSLIFNRGSLNATDFI
jgi:hypothetical protein